MPFIVMRRTDIPNGVLQVVDLKPNTSQRSYIYDPGDGQTGYIRQVPASDTVAVTNVLGDDLTNAEYVGLAAYLLDNVEDGVSGDSVTPAVANQAAADIAAAVQAGAAMDLASVDALLVGAGAGAGTGLEAGNSTGSLADLLGLLAGAEYVLPAMSPVNVGGAFNTDVSGSFAEEPATRTYYRTGAFLISNGEGNLAGMKSADFDYMGTMGAAVVVYDDDGSLL